MQPLTCFYVCRNSGKASSGLRAAVLEGRVWVDVGGRIWPQTCGVEGLG